MAQTPKAIRENINMFDYISLKFLMAKPHHKSKQQMGEIWQPLSQRVIFSV